MVSICTVLDLSQQQSVRRPANTTEQQLSLLKLLYTFRCEIPQTVAISVIQFSQIIMPCKKRHSQYNTIQYKFIWFVFATYWYFLLTFAGKLYPENKIHYRTLKGPYTSKIILVETQHTILGESHHTIPVKFCQ